MLDTLELLFATQCRIRRAVREDFILVLRQERLEGDPGESLILSVHSLLGNTVWDCEVEEGFFAGIQMVMASGYLGERLIL